jgi:cytochrome c551/c552
MPATEQTCRDQKRLHIVFAVSGVLMLIATIWMFAADHDREWKPYQRTANDVEINMTEWRKLQFRTNAAAQMHQQLETQLTAVRRTPIDHELLAEFKDSVIADQATADFSFDRIDGLARQLADAEPESGGPIRKKLMSDLNVIVASAKFREDTLLGRRKFKSADRDAAVAKVGLLLRDGKPLAEQDAQQDLVEELKQELDEVTRQYQEATAHREALDRVLKQITQSEDAAFDLLDKNQTELRQLDSAIAGRRSTYLNWLRPVSWLPPIPIPGKKWLELPIADAFNSPRKIDNLWSEGLMIDYNFSKVRRFDRCTTCHQLIEKTMPGSAVVAAYEQQREVNLLLLPPEDESGASETPAAGGEETAETSESVSVLAADERAANDLEQVYGLRLAAEGLLKRTDVMVQYVRPESRATQAESYLTDEDRQPVLGDQIRPVLLQPGSEGFEAQRDGPGFQVGDVIVEINQDGNQIYDSERTMYRLLDAANTQQPLIVTVRRGMPSPYSSHPRLDLFVGSRSPHKTADFACTICHEGQGSATAFKWASHSPNSAEQRQQWMRDHGWFDNHHWIYPMYPKRFAEASCLKCHHQVTDLEPSKRFVEAPAPKVTHGYHLVRKYACYGCHEINGFDRADQVGPDLRLEPNVFAAALQLKIDPAYAQLSDDSKDWVEQLIQHPDRDAVRYRLYEVLLADEAAEEPLLSAETHTQLTPLFKDIDHPGTLRKAGPSLRFVAQKIGTEFLADWIRAPKHFRPTTRMPQFFGNTQHLDDDGKHIAGEFEPLEVLGLATFLGSKSQPFEYLQPAADAVAPSAERGRLQFEQRGCLACHNHKDYSDASEYRDAGSIVQGPDLSGIGDKLADGKGRQWLYSWIREPTRYHARTVMPDLFLEAEEDAEGKLIDPANDIVEYLLGTSKIGWQPAPGVLVSSAQVDDEPLNRLVLAHLKDVYSEASAIQYAKTGIPANFRAELKGAELELLASADPAYFDRELTREQKLNYVGAKSVAKYGCYGCHDIAGFEDSKPIGTGLADWGRKEPSKLAFEHIMNYLGHGHGPAHADGGHETDGQGDDAGNADEHAEDDSPDPFFIEQIQSHHRTGFLYQKLREPRSYDYHKTANKKYNEWLRMPQFPFDADDREAVMTFVLGLVADPPSEKYIFQPDAHQLAIIEGRQVLEKFNCAGCHMLEPQRWSISYTPDTFGTQPLTKTFPFLKTHFAPAELDGSLQMDQSGLRHATVSGMPTLDDFGAPLVYDDLGDPVEDDFDYDRTTLEYPLDLWRPTALSGSVFEVGVAPLNLRAGSILEKDQAAGGFLAKYLLPRVVAREKSVNPNAKGSEAWGWVPPPLIGEGHKVQTDWLHDFLLNPYRIRPSVVLRMPRFNMTPAEASQLVNYFAAVDNAEYPYAFSARRQSGHLEDAEQAYRATSQVTTGSAATGASTEHQRFRDAMNIVVNTNYCVKCHLVGDFNPPGPEIAKAPDLAQVYRRLRPEFMRAWIANPKSILPYTSMPVNLPYDADLPNLGGVAQDLYHGTSIEQVDGLVDLLMNFDQYTKQRSLIAPLVKEAAPVTPDGQLAPVPTTGGGARE